MRNDADLPTLGVPLGQRLHHEAEALPDDQLRPVADTSLMLSTEARTALLN
jgi:hypothetical protein